MNVPNWFPVWFSSSRVPITSMPTFRRWAVAPGNHENSSASSRLPVLVCWGSPLLPPNASATRVSPPVGRAEPTSTYPDGSLRNAVASRRWRATYPRSSLMKCPPKNEVSEAMTPPPRVVRVPPVAGRARLPTRVGSWDSQLPSSRDATAFLRLPSGYVDVGSALPTGGETLVALAFGGNSGLPQHTNTGSLELADEFSWLPGATAHRLKVGIDVIGTRLEENQTGNQFGTFIYPSLAALAADSPAMFTRTVVPQVHPGTAWNSAVYAGDTWRMGPGGALRLTYGARLETARFSGAPLYNRAVDSVFGVRTDRIPSEVHVSPRLGFTWAGGDGSDGPQTTFLRGGVGDFRSLTPTALYAAALSAPGLSSAQTQLICVGSAVPTPDWSLYAQDPSTIPTQCTDTAPAVTLTPPPSVTAFAPD